MHRDLCSTKVRRINSAFIRVEKEAQGWPADGVWAGSGRMRRDILAKRHSRQEQEVDDVTTPCQSLRSFGALNVVSLCGPASLPHL